MHLLRMEMETRSRKKASETGPLPEERRGIPGAIAGDDSVQADGDQMLNRRALVGTPEERQPEQWSEVSSPALPTEGAAQVFQPALTQAGLPRQRRKWTKSINETILRIYYRITKNGTDVTGYRQKLHTEFQQIFPDFSNVTEQRLADQYRVILRNRLTPETRLEAIREEVRRELETVEEDNEYGTPTLGIDQEETEEEEDDTLREASGDERLVETLRDGMREAVSQFRGTNPLTRPILPKINSSRRMARILDIMNREVLPNSVEISEDLESLHLIVYCAAVTVVRALGIDIEEQPIRRRGGRVMPPWERRLTMNIAKLRCDIGRMVSYVGGIRSNKLERRVKYIMRNNRNHTQRDAPNVTAQHCLDTLKQRLSVLANRLSRYRVSRSRKRDNAMFIRSQKNFYRNLGEKKDNSAGIFPTGQQVSDFWSRQLSASVICDMGASWMEEERRRCEPLDTMQLLELSSEEVSDVIKNQLNWKAPGPDRVQNFWYKRFWCMHQRLTDLINDVLQDPAKMPDFLTQGATYLIPKDVQNQQDPSKYRPITCLPTMYKIITSCISRRIYSYCRDNNIIAEQQKGCRKGSMGCKEQLIIDSVVCGQAYAKHRNLYMAYIDYKKAFDSVPHIWLMEILKIYKIEPRVILFLEYVMRNWRTKLALSTPSGDIETEVIAIRRGIFQGDSLSPLWFVLCMNPLSNLLNSSNSGFAIKKEGRQICRLNHLLYMDDVKLFASTKTQLDDLLSVVEKFSRDIKMEFGLDKCRTLNVVRGKLQEGSFELENGQVIEAMLTGEIYKYLGMKQARHINHGQMKEELTGEFFHRVRRILKTKLNGKNVVRAVNSYAVPVLNYSFGIVKWSKTDIEGLQRKVRVLMTKARMHHPKSAVERMTLPRHMGGRGMADIGNQLCRQVKNLRKFFHAEANESALHRAICEADISTPLLLSRQEVVDFTCSDSQKLDVWMAKSLHGRHLYEVSQAHVDMKASNFWLTSGQIFPETEGFMLAIQDQVIPTRNYLKLIVKDENVQSEYCRYGCPTVESIQHITSGCTQLSGVEYKQRHDAVAKILHQELAEKFELLTGDKIPYFKYQPELVLENRAWRLYWDRTILTDRTVVHNRPDIVVMNKREKCVTLIDITIPNNNNLQSKFVEKIKKYAELVEPIKKQWRMEKVDVIPIIISSTGVIPKSLMGGLKQLGVKIEIYKLMQKAVVIATTRIVRKFMGNDVC